MIGIVDILGALEERIHKVFPEEKVYKDYQPVDFVRPSFLITAGKVEAEPYNQGALELTLGVVIRGFVKVDEYYQSHFQDLINRMAQVLNLFYDGFLQVGTRAPHIVDLAGQYQYDYFEVTFSLQWGETLIDDDAKLPLMQDLKLNFKEG